MRVWTGLVLAVGTREKLGCCWCEKAWVLLYKVLAERVAVFESAIVFCKNQKVFLCFQNLFLFLFFWVSSSSPSFSFFSLSFLVPRERERVRERERERDLESLLEKYRESGVFIGFSLRGKKVWWAYCLLQLQQSKQKGG